MRRIAQIGLVLGVAALLLLGGADIAASQTSTQTNSTATPTSSPTPTASPTTTPSPTPTATPTPSREDRLSDIRDGPYDITELRKNGDVPPGSDIPTGVRALGTPPQGFAGARYRAPTLIDALTGSPGQWQQVGPDVTVEQNSVQIYGSAFGDVAGEYEVVVVYWQPKVAQVGNGTTTYASNQTIDRKTVQIGGTDNLYTFANVSLRQHVDETWMVTMWLERGGDPVDGAQWHFKHRSNPSQQAAPNINSQADLWAWGIKNIGLSGMAGVIVGLVLSRVVLRRTARGPGYGVRSWVLITIIVGTILSITAYYQIAVILQHFPWVMGISIGVVAFAAGLTIHPEEKRIGFMRRELYDAITNPGGNPIANEMADGGVIDIEDAGAEMFDELAEVGKLDLPEVPAVRTEDGYRIPEPGIRPFFARMFADAAILNLEGIATRQKVDEGRIDEIIVVDPNSKQAIEHKPARFKRMLPWDSMKYDVEETGEKPSVYEKAFAAVLTFAILVFPPVGGMMLADWLINLPGLGFLLGAIATIGIAYSAEDGWIDYVAAPIHYKKVEDSLTMLQKALSWSADEETAQEQLWRERATTAREGLEQRDAERRTVTDDILEKRGVKRDRPELEDGDDD